MWRGKRNQYTIQSPFPLSNNFSERERERKINRKFNCYLQKTMHSASFRTSKQWKD